MNERKKYNKLKKELRGHLAIVGKICGKSLSHVSRVLDCQYQDDELIEAAIKYRNELMKKKQTLLNKI